LEINEGINELCLQWAPYILGTMTQGVPILSENIWWVLFDCPNKKYILICGASTPTKHLVALGRTEVLVAQYFAIVNTRQSDIHQFLPSQCKLPHYYRLRP